MSNSKPASTAGGPASPSRESQLAKALQLMQRALGLIDEADAPADIAAHLDLAIIRLTELIDSSESKS
jgi:hypothetical protein